MKFKEIQVTYKATEKEQPKESMTQPEKVVNAFKNLEDETKEKFICIHLDNRMRINCFEIVAIGGLDACVVNPREVFKTTFLTNSRAVILVHNHPSGVPEPSENDIAVTHRLRRAGDILGIDIIDHIIIGKEGFLSFKDRGLLEKETGK